VLLAMISECGHVYIKLIKPEPPFDSVSKVCVYVFIINASECKKQPLHLRSGAYLDSLRVNDLPGPELTIATFDSNCENIAGLVNFSLF